MPSERGSNETGGSISVRSSGAATGSVAAPRRNANSNASSLRSPRARCEGASERSHYYLASGRRARRRLGEFFVVVLLASGCNTQGTTSGPTKPPGPEVVTAVQKQVSAHGITFNVTWNPRWTLPGSSGHPIRSNAESDGAGYTVTDAQGEATLISWTVWS